MSIALVNKVKRLRVGHPIAKSILLYLADTYGPNGCFVSQGRIAGDLELSTRSVIRYLEYLDQKGLITRTVEEKNGKIMRTGYELLSGDRQAALNSDSQTPINLSSGDCQSTETPVNGDRQSQPYKGTLNGKKNVTEEIASSKPKQSGSRNPGLLKTRPDLSGRDYLAWLSSQPENSRIGVTAIYEAMEKWCAAKNRTPSRMRLLKWLEKERADVPFEAGVVCEPSIRSSGPTQREAIEAERLQVEAMIAAEDV